MTQRGLARLLIFGCLALCPGCGSSIVVEPFAEHGAIGMTPPSTMVTTFVADQVENAIDEFPSSARGNKAPSARIVGPDTRLSSPFAVAIDPQGDIHVPNYGASEIDEYAPGANGDAAPIASIAGSLTQLDGPQNIKIDDTGRIYVRCRHLVAEFDAGASGNVPPAAVLSGPMTHIEAGDYPGLAVDASGQVYQLHNASGVANAINIFAAGANGDVRPAKKLTGSLTQLNGMIDIELGSTGKIYVLQRNGGASPYQILEFPPGSHGNVPPDRIIQGPLTTLNGAAKLGIDPKGKIFVSQGSALIVFAPDANGDVAPLYTIQGQHTELKDPGGLAFF